MKQIFLPATSRSMLITHYLRCTQKIASHRLAISCCLCQDNITSTMRWELLRLREKLILTLKRLHRVSHLLVASNDDFHSTAHTKVPISLMTTVITLSKSKTHSLLRANEQKTT